MHRALPSLIRSQSAGMQKALSQGERKIRYFHALYTCEKNVSDEGAKG